MRAFSKDHLASVVIAPHVSEKSARVGADGNHYVFRVRRDATKPEIRAAVEFLFEVKVDAVRAVNQAGKAEALRPLARPPLRLEEGVRAARRGAEDRIGRQRARLSAAA